MRNNARLHLATRRARGGLFVTIYAIGGGYTPLPWPTAYKGKMEVENLNLNK
jgi:hypothetical protein